MSQELAPGFGQQLAEAREAKGLTVAEVGERLKLTSRQVEALEAEDYSRLPAAVFVRGFVRNYARLVELPLETMPESVAAPVEDPSTRITIPTEGVVLRTSPVRRWLLLPLLGLILFVALVAALYNWLRQGEDAYLTSSGGGGKSTMVVTPVQPLKPLEPLNEPAAAPQPAPPKEPTASHKDKTSQSSSPSGQQVTQVHSITVPQPAASDSAAAKPSAEAAPAKPSSAPSSPTDYSYGAGGGHVVSLAAGDEQAWVDVTSADQKHYSRLLKPGDTMTVSGKAPFKVVVGNAKSVRLVYDSNPVSLKGYTGRSVARLTLQ